MLDPIESLHLDGARAVSAVGAPSVRDARAVQSELRQMMQWGWQFLWKGNYDKAMYWYKMVFAYYQRYGVMDDDLRAAYFVALSQYGWLMILKGQEGEVNQRLNTHLMAYLKTVWGGKENRDESIRDIVRSLQNQGKMPTRDTADMRVEPETLEWLSDQMAQRQLKMPALNLMRFAQVAVSLQQVDLAHRLTQLETGMKNVEPQKILPRIPILQWLPYAPTQGPMKMEFHHKVEDMHPDSELEDAMSLDELEGMLAVSMSRQRLKDQNQKRQK